MTQYYRERRVILLIALGLALSVVLLLYGHVNQTEPSNLGVKKEFEIRGLTWRTISYYYHPGIYGEVYDHESNLRIIKKAKNVGANYLLVRVFYNGTVDGGLLGNDTESEQYLEKAISMAHDQGMKILLTPYVESRDYVDKKWVLSEEAWSEKVLRWAEFAEKNEVEMFSPGVEMSLILDEEEVGEWYKKILPKVRRVYTGRVITAEHYDIERWKILDNAGSFAGYDCIGLTVFPRKEYDGVSDIRSMSDYEEYVEAEARTLDMLAEKYNIQCKLAVPIGLDYWNGSHQITPVPDAAVVAEATEKGLDILKKHNFTGVFISHWASEPDQFKEREDVENMLKERWTEAK